MLDLEPDPDKSYLDPHTATLVTHPYDPNCLAKNV